MREPFIGAAGIMSEPLFCPKCFSKNEPSAEYCTFCQTPLRQRFANVHTTARVSGDATVPELIAPCKEWETAVPHLGFALLIMSQPNPVVVERGAIHVLGRFDGDPVEVETDLIDLSDYGAVELGVSRRHAEISYTGEAFVLRDLDSTNGTWLNQMRLTPNAHYVLQSNDQIILGRLVMWVCLGDEQTAPPPAQARFVLQAPAPLPGKPPGMSLEMLQAEVLPYLEALTAVQRMLDELGQRPLQPAILYRVGVGETAVVTLEAAGLSDALQAVRTHLTPWRTHHRDLIGAPLDEFSFLLEAEIVELVTALLADHAPHLSPERIQDAAITLRPWLEQLAAHPLTLL